MNPFHRDSASSLQYTHKEDTRQEGRKERQKEEKNPETAAQLPLAQEHLLSPCEKRD